MSTYAKIADLDLRIEGYELDRLEQQVSDEFRRVTTVIRLIGGNQEGLGEDVTYETADHDRLQSGGCDLPVTGTYSLAAFSAALDHIELFPAAPRHPGSRFYRRWAWESAALDLALQQSDQSLAGALGRIPRPVSFVVSPQLGAPPTSAPVRAWLEGYPTLRFKLDPTSEWDASLIEELVRTSAVDVVDFKGHYSDTPVDRAVDPALYERVALAFPQAWLEDPVLDTHTEPILAPHRDRLTWDAPIHSIADIETLLFPPRMINIKPSRFGSLRRLMGAYDFCQRQGIAMYGGGQFELGPGRGQIQYLASLFHPNTANDVAPTGFNRDMVPTDSEQAAPPPGLPSSPLPAMPSVTGFRWGRR